MKFGDIVVNDWAGDSNPQKVLMVLKHSKDVICLSLNGEKVVFNNDKDLRLRKVAEIDFSEWTKIAHNIKSRRLARRAPD